MDCFYKNGLKFECKNCGHCCADEPGYVFLSEKDIQVLSDGLNLSKDDFIITYCRTIDFGAMKLVSLIEKDNYDCVFLTDKGCKVYEYRPIQCRTYPFWQHILEDEKSWNDEALQCPGMNKGKIHSKKEIESYLNDRLGNNPLILK